VTVFVFSFVNLLYSLTSGDGQILERKTRVLSGLREVRCLDQTQDRSSIRYDRCSTLGK
jgi:hypothetical protein